MFKEIKKQVASGPIAEGSYIYAIVIGENVLTEPSICLALCQTEQEARHLRDHIEDAYEIGFRDGAGPEVDYDAIVDWNLDHEQVEARHKELWML